jgi:hypothetical protein
MVSLADCVDSENQLTTFTIDGPSGTIVLKAPELGNSNNVLQSRIQRRNRANVLTVFKADYWPQSEPIKVRFSLTDDEKVALATFLSSNVGELFTLTDHESQVFTNCFLINLPEFEHINNCLYQVNLEFEQII